jgi:hypothetical protein
MLKRRYSIFVLSAFLLLATNCRQPGSGLKDTIPGVSDTGARLGYGYDSYQLDIKDTACVRGRVEKIMGGAEGKIKIVDSMTAEGLIDQLTNRGGFGLRLPILSANFGVAEMKSHVADSYSRTISVIFYVPIFIEQFEPHTITNQNAARYESGSRNDQGNRPQGYDPLAGSPSDTTRSGNFNLAGMNEDGYLDNGPLTNLLKKNGAGFVVCGDEFIHKIEYGIQLIGTLKVDFLTKADKEAFDMNFGINANMRDLFCDTPPPANTNTHNNNYGRPNANNPYGGRATPNNELYECDQRWDQPYGSNRGSQYNNSYNTYNNNPYDRNRPGNNGDLNGMNPGASSPFVNMFEIAVSAQQMKVMQKVMGRAQVTFEVTQFGHNERLVSAMDDNVTKCQFKYGTIQDPRVVFENCADALKGLAQYAKNQLSDQLRELAAKILPTNNTTSNVDTRLFNKLRYHTRKYSETDSLTEEFGWVKTADGETVSELLRAPLSEDILAARSNFLRMLGSTQEMANKASSVSQYIMDMPLPKEKKEALLAKLHGDIDFRTQRSTGGITGLINQDLTDLEKGLKICLNNPDTCVTQQQAVYDASVVRWKAADLKPSMAIFDDIVHSIVFDDEVVPDFENFAGGQPDNALFSQHCVFIRDDGKWEDEYCDKTWWTAMYKFACKDKSTKQWKLSADKGIWVEWKHRCPSGTEFATPVDKADNEKLRKLIEVLPEKRVWISYNDKRQEGHFTPTAD